MYDLALAYSSLNYYIIRLINSQEDININDSIFQNYTELNNKNNINSSYTNIKSINHYKIIGLILLYIIFNLFKLILI